MGPFFDVESKTVLLQVLVTAYADFGVGPHPQM